MDVELLREALSRLLRHDDDQGSLICRLVVEGAEPAVAAAERGVSRPSLTELLREAVAARGVQYELVAHASLHAKDGRVSWHPAHARRRRPGCRA